MPVQNRFHLSLFLIAVGGALALASGCAATGPSGLRPEPAPASGEAASSGAPRVDRSRLVLAPELASTVWINSPPLAAADLRGRVVVVDFWTFACYNCKNTLPYLKAWDQAYRDRGLVIIGVHTPELSIERDVDNVRQAVRDYEIRYAVAVDGDYANWNRYRVEAWPTWFIVDKEGYIRYSHIGEGDYKESEATIRQLLAE